MPVSRSPTSSQARAIPMISNATSRLPRISAAPLLCGFRMSSMPAASSNVNVTRRRVINASCRGTCRRAIWLEKIDRAPAAVKKMAMTASVTAQYPTLSPGTRAISEIVSALENARMEAPARTCRMTAGRSDGLGAARHGHGHKQQASQCGRAPSDGREQIPVGPRQHGARTTCGIPRRPRTSRAAGRAHATCRPP